MIIKSYQLYLLLRLPEILAVWSFGVFCNLIGWERAEDWAAKTFMEIVK